MAVILGLSPGHANALHSVETGSGSVPHHRLVSARGYNIESLTSPEVRSRASRITIRALRAAAARQILRQVEKIRKPSMRWLTEANCVERGADSGRVRAPEGKRTTLLTEAEIFRARVVTPPPKTMYSSAGYSGKVGSILDVVRPYELTNGAHRKGRAAPQARPKTGEESGFVHCQVN